MDVGRSLFVDTSQTAPADADPRLAGVLEPGELLIDKRLQAVLTRVTDDRRSSDPMPGALFLTDRRLLHLDGQNASINLAEIEELAIAGDRLLVTLAGLHGVIVDIESAAEFRAAISAAISALRAR